MVRRQTSVHVSDLNLCFDDGELILHTEHASLVTVRYIENSTPSRYKPHYSVNYNNTVFVFIMEYLILIVLFSTSFSKSVSKTRMNLLNYLKAPLFAELDVSNVQNYIDRTI